MAGIALLLTLISGIVLCDALHSTRNITALIKMKKQLMGRGRGSGCCPQQRNMCNRPSYQFLFNHWRQNMGNGRSNRDCDAIFQGGTTTSGVHAISIRGNSLNVYCDMQFMGHNWIRIQHRTSNAQNFAMDWAVYQSGFGDLAGANFWLGLNAIHQLTFHLRCPVLRIDLTIPAAGNNPQITAYAEYSIFRVAGMRRRYQLRVGGYTGNAGDGMAYHNGMQFSTQDNDNDREHFGRNCAMLYGGGGWWYRDCYTANLNGMYGGPVAARNGITWYLWRSDFNSIPQVTMRVRNGRN